MLQQISFTSKYDNPICIALGFFDCVHLGHKALIDKAKARAEQVRSKACVITFANSPYGYLGKDDKPIFTLDERIKLFEDCGVDCVLVAEFDERFMKMSKDEFLAQLFKFPIRSIVCGHDYRFGCKAEGNADYLSNFCAKNNIVCDIIAPVLYEGKRVSSTSIRTELTFGHIEAAQRLMGHNYFISGTVCHGRGVGKLFDFPTANIDIGGDKLLPADGVYATVAVVDGKRYRAVTNVGNKPTFDEASLSVETMLMDFDGDLYGKNITVEFVKWLRKIKKFSSPYELKEQIYKDANRRI